MAPLSRKHPQTTVMSVITVMVARKPLIYAVCSMTMNMTILQHTSDSPSCRNPIGVGKRISHDAHDGDDDELQRFSKWGAPLYPEMRGGAMGREHGEYKRDKARRCSRLVRPLGDRKRDMLQLHPAAASRSPRAPDSRPTCAGRSPRAALAENAARVFATPAFSTLL